MSAKATQTQDDEEVIRSRRRLNIPFVQTPTWVIDSGIEPGAFMLYVALLDHARGTDEAYPKRSHLAKRLGVSVRTISNRLNQLIEAKLVTVLHQYRKADGTITNERKGFIRQIQNVYIIETEKPDEREENFLQGKGEDNFLQDSEEENFPPRRRSMLKKKHIEEESEPADSDAVLEPGVVDEAEETQTRLLDALDDAVEANGFKRPGRTKANQRAMRLLLTKDGYTETQVSWMIGWATDHHFWYKNIRSAEKLRQQFDRLVVEAKEQRGGGPAGGMKPNSAEQRVEDHRSVRERMIQLQAEMDAKAGGQRELG